ncbi:2,4-dichlorophenol 6-monooxygenase [Sphingobium sp. TA15]|uniref:Dichlorophenol hydroxylase n=1 Tax=Sphingobium indicum (strain DSM 16413 / CCM 7287 / MTCC 6362 / UT26 / NBRC 101211 / UT26S) TaxID=452662 RepID=D4Z2W9_SPHIU|nr:FAD-dependent monooxygenase [Sphingobium indicum]BAI96951.1 dichlorophenol hydroxylase [Sphingobium indicum UT26S]BDD66383.1 2,4-dichlorophenol 6-monooxygenase [Sphingobium sp. TA15]
MSTESGFDTDILIIGTGPAGAASAAALATYGVRCQAIGKFGWTARTPRAHITNQRTMEILRDLGLEQEALGMAVPNTQMGENTYCTSLTGTELGRLLTWGMHPARRADYDLASPTSMCDLPQNMMEPLLIAAAAKRGAKIRFDTEYLSSTQDAEGVTTTVKDHLTGAVYTIRSRYLIGADGANSRVVADYGLPLEGRMGVSGSMNIVFDCDLSKYVAHRPSVLYWIIQPGSSVGGLGIGVIRMVRTWNKWLAIWGYDIEQGPPQITEEFARGILHKLIGDDRIPIKIEATSTWTVNDAYATTIAKGRVFCMGDAIHRHPPTNGLGSNASIGDAYNLAWKLAHVVKGQAAPSLLESYDLERAPVAEQVVKRANKSLGCFPPILQALGLLDTQDPEEMRRNMAALQDDTQEAAARREALRAAIQASDYVYNCHGVEMNQRYASGAVVDDGSPEPAWLRDPELYHQASSRPGAHLPHVWLSENGRRVAAMDLCGNGRFTLLTGISGAAWEQAAAEAAAAFGIEIAVHRIGPGQRYDDPYGDFAAASEVADDGALLVRPDIYVGWRARRASATAAADLIAALGAILGFAPAAALREAAA